MTHRSWLADRLSLEGHSADHAAKVLSHRR